MTTRRLFLLGAASILAAPAVIRIPGLLMPIKPVPRPWSEVPMTAEEITLRRMMVKVASLRPIGEEGNYYRWYYDVQDFGFVPASDHGITASVALLEQRIEALRA